MTRSEIIANHIATLRASVSDGLRNHAQSTFAHAIYAALATPGCEGQDVRLVDLPRLAERVAEMADAHEALRAERDAARAKLAAIDNLLLARLGGWEESTTPHPDQPEMGPMPTLTDSVARALEDLTLARGEVAGLRDRIAYLEAGLGALVRHNAGTGACLPDCITNTDDGEDCDCGYIAAEDPGGFAADLLLGEAEVISERAAAGMKS